MSLRPKFRLFRTGYAVQITSRRKSPLPCSWWDVLCRAAKRMKRESQGRGWGRVLLAVLGIVALAAATALAADWPQWRGPDRTGVSRETGLLKAWPAGGPKLAWKATNLGEGYSAPSVANGRIYGM